MVGKKLDQNGYRRLRHPGFDDLTMSLAFLPDIKTEQLALLVCQCSIKTKRIPTLKHRRLYPSRLLNPLVKSVGPHYGIDGFRVDTAKHVELPAWSN